MGIALPLAVGHAKAAPDKKVVAFVGDAGLEMVMSELATLRDLRLPVVIVVLVDETLSLIDLKQARSNLPQPGVMFGATDFVGIAQAYGGNACRVTDIDTLNDCVTDAFASDMFSLIACKIDKSAYAGAFWPDSRREGQCRVVKESVGIAKERVHIQVHFLLTSAWLI